MRADKKTPIKSDKKAAARSHKRGVVGYSKKTALLEDAITQMNAGKYGRSSAALKELLALDPHNMEARRLFATLHLRLGSLIPARQAFDSLINEAFERQDYWLAESLLREYLTAGPRCVPFLEKLGAVYQEKGDSLEAVAEYGKAIDILIEDPDPENPHRASQLYAKIRDLAPASPIAFRLASFFDAQTGQLVINPPRAHEDAEAAESATSHEQEDPSAVLSMPDPITGPMPWEQIEDSTEATTFPESPPSPAQAESRGALYSPNVLPLEETVFLPASSGSYDVHQVEQSGISPETEARTESLEAVHSGEQLEVAPAENAASVVQDVSPPMLHDSVDGTSGSHSETHAADSITNEIVPAASLSVEEQDSPSPEIQQKIGMEVVSGPMPWEDVHESTITIPDQAPEHLPDSPSQQAEVSSAPLPEQESSVLNLDKSQEAGSSPAALTEAGENIIVTDEPAVPPSVPDREQSQAGTPSEMVKGSGFSWESIFNSAWKFGDKVIGPGAEPEGNRSEAIHIEETPTEAASSSNRQMPESEPIEIPEDVRTQATRESTAALSGPLPMPWDQVQESAIAIPPTVVEATVEETPRETVDQSAGSVEPFMPLIQEATSGQSQSQPFVSSSIEGSGTDSFSINHPPPASPANDPEFRIAGLSPPNPVQEGQAASAEAVELFPTSSRINEAPTSFDLDSSQVMVAPTMPTSDEVVDDVSRHAEPMPQYPEETSQAEATEPAPVPTIRSAPGLGVRTENWQIQDVPTFWQDENVTPAPLPPAVDSTKPLAQVERMVQQSSSALESPVSPEPVVEPTMNPSPHTGDPAQGRTGESAVQTDRPSSKRRKKTPEVSSEISEAQPSPEETFSQQSEWNRQQETAHAEARARIPEPVSQPEEWRRTGDSIRFIEEPQSLPVVETESWASAQIETDTSQPVSTVAAAVDVLFDSSGRFTRSETRERVAEPKRRPKIRSKLNRFRIQISVFISSCFSTTRAIVTSLVALTVLSSALVALGIGALGLVWVVMEEPPSPAFQSLTTSPQRTLLDSKKNGYLLLLGFDAAPGQDPIQVGYERKPEEKDADMALGCLGGSGVGARAGQSNASANVAGRWFRGSDPAGQFRSHQDTIKGWVAQGESALGRYHQWQKLSFEDWGYGQTISPPCASIVFAHQLSLADGFVQGTDIGMDRLETDMEAWRIALGQAKTLPVKTLALQAINDDIAVASGLLVRPDFDGKYLTRLSKMLRPLDQVELSIRWPMQSELVSATKTFEAQMKAERGEEQGLYAVVASALPLPKQRRFNDYAEYYEASYKASGEGRYGSLPKWKNYIRFPANSVMDYLSNPLENIVGLDPLAPWDLYNGLVVDTDAHLRLASLQAWLRRGAQDADLLARIAKAGQNFYDPYTGLPMLVNMKKGVMYSVGHDGKDQDADPQSDVVVAIPASQSPAQPAKPSSGSSKSK